MSWSFSDVADRRESKHLTHSYHRYPAKFIPQIVETLLDKYSKETSVVCDPFGGCGTTLIVAKLSGHSSIGFDINPVAKLIAEAKLCPIDPSKLDAEVLKLQARISKIKFKPFTTHPRLRYWFKTKDLNQLSKIHRSISYTRDSEIKRFFLCCFSHILKNTSIWLMSSIKPTRDLNKTIPNALEVFSMHLSSMVKRNKEYHDHLKEEGVLKTPAEMQIGDARKLPLRNNSVDHIITSPPYVTSYEYADLHQLSLLWFKFTKDLPAFRKKFIGTTMSVESVLQTQGEIGKSIVESLKTVHEPTSRRVNKYFTDMGSAITEMYRVTKPGGHVSIIVGNTNLKGVEIRNAEVAHEQMLLAGFKVKQVVKREIGFQVIAPWRDKVSGRFTNKEDENRKQVYQYEYIITMQK